MKVNTLPYQPSSTIRSDFDCGVVSTYYLLHSVRSVSFAKKKRRAVSNVPAKRILMMDLLYMCSVRLYQGQPINISVRAWLCGCRVYVVSMVLLLV